ncbi:MAG: hypothetical protein DMG50_25370 [Acidobacteria bacterium]|nr:MAG: hypothetical protein DMG50_25370 [Acidobacteriota bacterium]
MPRQDRVVFAKGVVFLAAIFLAILYFLEYNGSLMRAHTAIWKKPKRWQLIAPFILWGFIITVVIMLVRIHSVN